MTTFALVCLRALVASRFAIRPYSLNRLRSGSRAGIWEVNIALGLQDIGYRKRYVGIWQPPRLCMMLRIPVSGSRSYLFLIQFRSRNLSLICVLMRSGKNSQRLKNCMKMRLSSEGYVSLTSPLRWFDSHSHEVENTSADSDHLNNRRNSLGLRTAFFTNLP